ncbi:MAG: Fe2+-dependent dioxygenase [Alphaproteobacteria bacterium]
MLDADALAAVRCAVAAPNRGSEATCGCGLHGAGDAAERRIASALMGHAGFFRAALPRRILRLTISRHTGGMGQGRHVVAASADAHRVDLGFTLFLSDPLDYDRGELIVESNAGWESHKHAAGDLLLYPARYVHSVAPVTRGTRLVAVGWVESLTPSAERREVLGDLDAALSLLDESCGRTDARLRIENARANLVRLWLGGGA